MTDGHVCSACGFENEPRARFCVSCGAALPSEPPVRSETRRVVTVLCSDVVGFTGIGHELDPESLRGLMARYFERVQTIVDRHGGTTEKFIGDAVVAVFGVPHLHEDDAHRAVRAAVEIRDARAELNEEFLRDWGVELRIRTGVNTGEVVAGDPAEGQSFVSGDAVNVAARLEQAAAPDEILVGETTYRLVGDAVTAEPLVPLTLKGKPEPVAAWRVLEMAPVGPRWARRLDSPLVGREHELDVLRTVFDRSVESRECHVATVMGVAGVGKSRLTGELVATIGERATVVGGRCLPYGEGITFWPITELLQGAAGVSESDPPSEARRKLDLLLEDSPDVGARRRPARRLSRACLGNPGRPRDVLVGSEAPRDTRRATAAPRGLRRHPVGGADVPRPARVPRRLDSRSTGHAALPGATRAAWRRAGAGSPARRTSRSSRSRR